MTEAIPYKGDCAECAQLQRQEQDAREERDMSSEVDTRVKARRHLRKTHGVHTAVRS